MHLTEVVDEALPRPQGSPEFCRVDPGSGTKQDHVPVLEGPAQLAVYDGAVALLHEQQDAIRPTAGEVDQQLVHRVTLPLVCLKHGQRTVTHHCLCTGIMSGMLQLLFYVDRAQR